MSEADTFVALSTPPGEAALALVRLSGPLCERIARQAFQRAGPPQPRLACFGKYLGINGKQIDEGVYTFFVEGASFTGDPMLEITVHGNPLIVQQLIEDLIARGCRAAEPGEFTRTAFLNGRLDLSQAEAVADLIRARSERSLEAARRQLHGSVGRKIGELTGRLLGVIAAVEAYIDFPEEDLPPEDAAGPARDLRALLNEVRELIETRHYNALLHEGIKTMIVGPPNVGKSSLINALTGTERAIVSETAGTTRDYISAFIMAGPWRIEIMDTAGLHEAADAVERMGIEHTLEQVETADYFLLMVDASLPRPTLPEPLFNRLSPGNTLVVENKTDLGDADGEAFLPGFRHVRLSLLRNEGLAELRQTWVASIEEDLARPGRDGVTVNARHAAALERTAGFLGEAVEKMEAGELRELVAADLREAVDALAEVVGRIDNEAVLDQLFAKFCIGK
jgi:tRNA modification GTPase